MKEREGPLIGLGNGHVTNELIVFSCDQQLLRILSVLTDSINQTFGKTVSFCTISLIFLQMLFPPCTDPLMKREPGDANCLYTPNKLAKIVWRQIENGAPGLYSFIQRFSFRVEEYTELLQYYNKHHKWDTRLKIL